MTGDHAYSHTVVRTHSGESAVEEHVNHVWNVFGRRNLLSDGCGTRQEQGPVESGVEVGGHVSDHVRARAGTPPSYGLCHGNCGLLRHPLRREVSSRWTCRNTALWQRWCVAVDGEWAQKGLPCLPLSPRFELCQTEKLQLRRAFAALAPSCAARDREQGSLKIETLNLLEKLFVERWSELHHLVGGCQTEKVWQDHIKI